MSERTVGAGFLFSKGVHIIFSVSPSTSLAKINLDPLCVTTDVLQNLN